MSLTQIQRIQLNKQVDKILHAPGNQPARDNQLEMAFVLDCSSDKEFLKSTVQDAVAGLKAHDKIFQNVRSNVVFWKDNDSFTTEVMPMSFIQMGKPFENEAFVGDPFDGGNNQESENKNVENLPVIDELCVYLKIFHARSKCILVFTENGYAVNDKKKVIENLNPFLKYKLLVISKDNMKCGTPIYMELISEQ